MNERLKFWLREEAKGGENFSWRSELLRLLTVVNHQWQIAGKFLNILAGNKTLIGKRIVSSLRNDNMIKNWNI